MRMREMKLLLLHCFFPNRCPFCEHCIEYTAHCCERCEETVLTLSPMTPQSTGYPTYARFPYEDGVVMAIRSLKFHSTLQNADHLGVFLSQGLPAPNELGVDLVTYVPMHRKQQRVRGFNQAQEIAKAVAWERNLPLVATLQKLRQTKTQHTLNREERGRNLEGAFAVISPQAITGKRILLVDDVYTTGETSKRSANLLQQAGAEMVVIATVAKTVRHNEIFPDGEGKHGVQPDGSIRGVLP